MITIHIFETLNTKRRDILELEETIRKEETNSKNMTREITHLQAKNRKDTQHIEELIQESNRQIQEYKEQIDSLNDIIKSLKTKQLSQNENSDLEELRSQCKVLKDERQNLRTSLETMEQGWNVDKKRIDELEEELSRKVALDYNTSLAAELEKPRLSQRKTLQIRTVGTYQLRNLKMDWK